MHLQHARHYPGILSTYYALHTYAGFVWLLYLVEPREYNILSALGVAVKAPLYLLFYGRSQIKVPGAFALFLRSTLQPFAVPQSIYSVQFLCNSYHPVARCNIRGNG